jgi:hypothetical protein
LAEVINMSAELNSFILLFVVVAGFVTTAIQIAGKLSFNAARIILVISWLVAVGLAGTAFTVAPLKHRAMAAAFVGFPYALVLLGIERWIARNPKHKQPATEGPAPNLICLGEDDLSVFLDKHEVFRETDFENPKALRSASIKFTNEPRPGRKVASIDNVRAEVIYYERDWPLTEAYRVHYGCWMNEETPYVSFNLSDKAVQQLIVGAFEEKSKGGFERRFTIYGNNPDRNVELTKQIYSECRGFRIKVRIIAGEHGEYTAEYDFELEIDPGSTYSFFYMSEDKKRQHRESTSHELQRRIRQGEALLKREHEGKYYSDVHEWRYGTEGRIRHLFGMSVSQRFYKAGSSLSQGKDGRLEDELSAKLDELKELSAEFDAGKLTLPFDL